MEKYMKKGRDDLIMAAWSIESSYREGIHASTGISLSLLTKG
jgi:hypothetical protein